MCFQVHRHERPRRLVGPGSEAVTVTGRSQRERNATPRPPRASAGSREVGGALGTRARVCVQRPRSWGPGTHRVRGRAEQGRPPPGHERRRRRGARGSGARAGRGCHPPPVFFAPRAPGDSVSGAAAQRASGRREDAGSREAATRAPLPGRSGVPAPRSVASEEARGLPAAAAPHALPRCEPRRSRGPAAAAGRLGLGTREHPRRPPRPPPRAVSAASALPSPQTTPKPTSWGNSGREGQWGSRAGGAGDLGGQGGAGLGCPGSPFVFRELSPAASLPAGAGASISLNAKAEPSLAPGAAAGQAQPLPQRGALLGVWGRDPRGWGEQPERRSCPGGIAGWRLSWGQRRGQRLVPTVTPAGRRAAQSPARRQGRG